MTSTTEIALRHRMSWVLDVPGRGRTVVGPVVIGDKEAEEILAHGYPQTTKSGHKILSWAIEEIHTTTTITVIATEKGIA